MHKFNLELIIMKKTLLAAIFSFIISVLFYNKATSQTLNRIQCILVTGSNNGAGLDHDSKLQIYLQPKDTKVHNWGIEFSGNDGIGGTENEGNTKNFDLRPLITPLTKDQINHKMEMLFAIFAVGHDHYNGSFQAIFYWSDNSTTAFNYDFGIGTYHESHITTKSVDF